MDVKLIMLPVSAGDATLLMASDSTHQYTVLIDAGLRDLEVVSYLQSIGIFHLDLVILSHPDMDHLGGLLPIIKSKVMSVDTIWCFDLAFLRHFVQTGNIPKPQEGTHEVIYYYQLLSTLDKFSDIHKSANKRNVQVLQVSEGYRLSLGPMLFEVLYPHQNFYNALHQHSTINQLIGNRKLPIEWSDNQNSNHENSEKASKIPLSQNEDHLTAEMKKPKKINEQKLLIDFEDLQNKSKCEHLW